MYVVSSRPFTNPNLTGLSLCSLIDTPSPGLNICLSLTFSLYPYSRGHHHYGLSVIDPSVGPGVPASSNCWSSPLLTWGQSFLKFCSMCSSCPYVLCACAEVLSFGLHVGGAYL